MSRAEVWRTLDAREEGANMKVVDPVCRMEIDSEKAVAKSEYQSNTYYFCAPGCKVAFDKNPQKYVGK